MRVNPFLQRMSRGFFLEKNENAFWAEIKKLKKVLCKLHKSLEEFMWINYKINKKTNPKGIF